MARQNRSKNMRRSRSRYMRGGEDAPDAALVPGQEGTGSATTDITGTSESTLDNITGAVGSATTAITAAAGTAATYLTAPAAAAPAAPAAAAPAEQNKSWYSGLTSWFGGGKRRKGSRRMRGGKGLGLDYYATSVDGLKVAQPTYMEYYKGGKRSTNKRRSCKRSSCKRRHCRKTCRKHRHCKK